MPLELRPATEDDALRSAEIESEAYSDNPFNKILFPGPFPPNIREIRASQLAQGLRDKADSLLWVKVVDTDAEGQPMVSFAEWQIYTTPPPPSQPRQFSPGMNAEACEMLFGGIARSRERHIGGVPHIYLRYLHTDPKYQGRGAGKMLVDWGIDESNKTGLAAFLESSPAGHSLYKKCGFEDVEVMSLDMSKWGAPHNHDTWTMKYNPVKA